MNGSTTEEFELFLSAHTPIHPQASFSEGERVGGWRLTAFLGKGGSGEVYRAECETDSSVAALKIHVPRPDKSDSQQTIARQRFEREARILSENTYPFFPRFYGQGIVRGCPYIILELLEPIALPSEDVAVAEFMLRISEAVRVLHVHGIVHRDIKPQNIMRRTNGEYVLIDLGLVKETSHTTSGSSVTLVDGKVVGVGTPHYAAPEQFNGGEISPASDIHALGIMADECFGGRPSRAWDRIINRSTSSLPKHRFENVDAFMSAIRHRHWRSRAFLFCGILILLLAAVVKVLLPPAPPHWSSLFVQESVPVEIRELLYERFATNVVGGISHIQLAERAERVRTNQVAMSQLILDERTIVVPDVSNPVPGVYRVVGPGSLNVDLCGGNNITLRLANCVFENRTKLAFPKNGIHYVLEHGALLRFPNQSDAHERSRYIDQCDGKYSGIEFGL